MQTQKDSAAHTGASNPAAKNWLSDFWKWLTGPLIEVNYKTGYYESTGPEEWQYKCNPGNGICEMEVSAGLTAGTTHADGFADATFGLSAAGNSLVMILHRNTMSDQTYQEHYADGIMTIPGPWNLQHPIRAALNLPTDYTIPEGEYIIHTTPDGDMYVIF